jgi:hypothetical protein
MYFILRDLKLIDRQFTDVAYAVLYFVFFIFLSNVSALQKEVEF